MDALWILNVLIVLVRVLLVNRIFFEFEKENILMCDDSPGDLDAAKINGVFYYPILVKKEKLGRIYFYQLRL